MFVGNTRSQPLSGASEMCLTRVDSALTRKHKTRLERRHNTQHNDIQHNGTLYTEFCLLSVPNKPFKLSVIMPSVVKLNVMAPLERLPRDKHSRLLQTLVGYSCKNLCNKDTWCQCYKTFYRRNLQIFVIR